MAGGEGKGREGGDGMPVEAGVGGQGRDLPKGRLKRDVVPGE